ncbi:S-adenosyl-L-methionine-dependent methyltransferase [Trichodelitschia bisporula]|uniref:DNA (cytosine-5-)-methyltransferase n=1 Tax=Trichodelitschia bisporula TaxID=703511 RepID=A0A6G1I3C3_9PEZI|nr:S-adenosyl-L-methionine-dependent methyltransferase [Trichodelitschia bisporula]
MDSDSDQPLLTPAQIRARPGIRERAIGLQRSELQYPKSAYHGWSHHLPVIPEKQALVELLEVWCRHQAEKDHSSYSGYDPSEDFIDFDLKDFAIYLPGTSDLENRNGELISLRNLSIGTGEERRVCGFPFNVFSVNGYDSLCPTAADIGIQSYTVQHRFRSRIWFRLGRLASEYACYYEPFLWIATFGKHFVDYLIAYKSVELGNFRTHFREWLVERYGNSEPFQKWLNIMTIWDFRPAVAAHFDYLWKEATNIGDRLRKRFVWCEVDAKKLRAVERQPPTRSKDLPAVTIVTPFVYEFFKKMPFAPVLHVKQAKESSLLSAIREGDMVLVSRDEKSVWVGGMEVWEAYVRKIYPNKLGEQYLQVTWMYRAGAMTLGENYPLQNELFMSDHCNCGSEDFLLADVLGKTNVVWSPKEVPEHDWFVRQTYRAEEKSFRTLQKEDFHSSCQEDNHQDDNTTVYPPGTAVLVKPFANNTVLEPAVVVYNSADGNIKICQLLRRNRNCGDRNAAPNELVWTGNILNLPANAIVRKCHIRTYTPQAVSEKLIPTPYDRGGQVDCFYITTRIDPAAGKRLQPLTPHERPPHRSLRGESSPLVPPVGAVDFISAGSPCQAFSLLQPSPHSRRSVLNASKLASIAAFIATYTPRYALLENVPSLTRSRAAAGLFGTFMGALSHGTPQSRTRLFIAAAAPGGPPLRPPQSTHAHPPGFGTRASNLDRAPDGTPYVQRKFELTPFGHVSPAAVCADLPFLGDGHVGVCAAQPDHRLVSILRPIKRVAIAAVPVGMNLKRASQVGVLGPKLEEFEARASLRPSHAYQRVKGEGLAPTITTFSDPTGSKAGIRVHWGESRCLTVGEVRRVQGYLDHKVVVGAWGGSWGIVGNGVARSIEDSDDEQEEAHPQLSGHTPMARSPSLVFLDDCAKLLDETAAGASYLSPMERSERVLPASNGALGIPPEAAVRTAGRVQMCTEVRPVLRVIRESDGKMRRERVIYEARDGCITTEKVEYDEEEA